MKIPLFILLPGLGLLNLVLKINGSVAPIPVLSGPDIAYFGSKVVFGCEVPGSSAPVIYQLIRDTKVIATRNLQAGQPASFPVRVTGTSEPLYHCRATAGGHTGESNSIRLLLVRARLTSDPDPPVLYEGSHLLLSCDVAGVFGFSYTWFFDRRKVTYETLPSLRLAGNKLAVENASARHAGIYSCMAERENRSSSSREVHVMVKVLLPKPKISLTISKVGTSYSGNVTCGTSRGSPPATFHFLLDGKELGSVTAADSTEASFLVAVVPGQDMGTVRCLVKNDVQQVMSEPLILEVVPVGGDVKVEVEYLYDANAKMACVKLHCLLSRGTFPTFSWIFNSSVLPTDTHTKSPLESMGRRFVLVDDGRALILATMDPGVSGYYQCRARDSYDDSSPWLESPAVLVQMTGVSMSIIEIISISFCCFMLVMLVGGVVFVVKMLHQQAHAGLGGSIQSEAHALSLGRMDSSSTDSDVHNQTLEITV